MLRTFFSTLGLLFSALALFCASFLFNVAASLDDGRDAYRATAVTITRDLSRTWKLSAVEQHYTAEARQEVSTVLEADLGELRYLGPLLHADDIRVEASWLRAPDSRGLSASSVADRLAALISRSAKVTFTAKFAGGLAKVVAELKREGGGLKLQRLRIENKAPPRPPEQPERRVISHASLQATPNAAPGHRLPELRAASLAAAERQA
jgi:hypothetical protein